jgi:hypothetical protein
MSEARLIKFRFTPGGAKKWRRWSGELKRRTEEVFETLRNEGVITEACFVSGDEDAVYYFVAAEDLGRAEEAARRSAFAIDREHTLSKSEALERIEQLECLFFFDNR